MASWIETIVETMGVFGIALLMFLENVFPPIPSELIMPLAGYNAAQGNANIFLVILAGHDRFARRSVLLVRPWTPRRPWGGEGICRSARALDRDDPRGA